MIEAWSVAAFRPGWPRGQRRRRRRRRRNSRTQGGTCTVAARAFQRNKALGKQFQLNRFFNYFLDPLQRKLTQDEDSEPFTGTTASLHLKGRGVLFFADLF